MFGDKLRFYIYIYIIGEWKRKEKTNYHIKSHQLPRFLSCECIYRIVYEKRKMVSALYL
jgi:hypothetical protein